MRILITGITGFVGSHMADYLLKNVPDVEIFATRRWRSKEDNIKHLFGNDRVILEECDLLDRGSLARIIHISKPDIVFHFAAQSFPESSFLTPVSTLTTNIIGTTNLLEELRLSKERNYCNPTIVSVSSSEVYGNVLEEETPITETNLIRAANPYSISKVGHDLMSQYYAKAFDMRVIITRMFSHEGKRRGKRFALSSFAHQIVMAEKDEKFPQYAPSFPTHPIRHGNLDSIRTYNHIDDAVHAYWLAVDNCDYGEVYNIGGDHTCSVGDALDMLISKSKTPKAFIKEFNSNRVRPTDITLQIPDSTKFRVKTGWKPTKGLEEICDDLLNYWREVL
ncbi:GDP-mannose 4,6-dehydratase [Candidatus Woesearchaeota archaeon]|jgi:GDP-mannose 4,6-dehydratase|nr:GDP-mannose 4,6-dehydratase [Candidatus Woesearchaeota archaeon]MBT7557649.1 GDP-mannose 4,6-dehydratase [Candidatus Woesearchaeota archaeon]